MRPPNLAAVLNRATGGSSRTMSDNNASYGTRVFLKDLPGDHNDRKNDHHHEDDHHSTSTATTVAHTVDISMSFSNDEDSHGESPATVEEEERDTVSPQQELVDLSSTDEHVQVETSPPSEQQEETEVKFSPSAIDSAAEQAELAEEYRKKALKKSLKYSAEKMKRRKRDQSLLKLANELAKYKERIDSQKGTIETLREEVKKKEVTSLVSKDETDQRIQEMKDVHEKRCNDYHRQLIKAKQEVTSLRRQVLAMKQHQYQQQGLLEQQKWRQQQEELRRSQLKCEQLQKQLQQQQRERHEQVLHMMNERFERLKTRCSVSTSGSASPPLSDSESSLSSLDSIKTAYLGQVRPLFVSMMRRLKRTSRSYRRQHPIAFGFFVITMVMLVAMWASGIFKWNGHPPSVSAGAVSTTESPQTLVIMPPDAEFSSAQAVDVWGNTFSNVTTAALAKPSPSSSHIVDWGDNTKINDAKSSSSAPSQRQQQKQLKHADDQVHSLFDQILTYSSSSGDDIPRLPNRVRGSSARTRQEVKKGCYWISNPNLSMGCSYRRVDNGLFRSRI